MREIILKSLVQKTVNNELRGHQKHLRTKHFKHLSFCIYTLPNLLPRWNQNQIPTNPRLRYAMLVFREIALNEVVFKIRKSKYTLTGHFFFPTVIDLISEDKTILSYIISLRFLNYAYLANMVKNRCSCTTKTKRFYIEGPFRALIPLYLQQNTLMVDRDKRRRQRHPLQDNMTEEPQLDFKGIDSIRAGAN